MFSSSIFAWDSVGHRVIATIAYEHLSAQTKKQVDILTEILDPKYPALSRFLYASVLPDKWRKDTSSKALASTHAWHFINKPWSVDGTSSLHERSPNLVTTMQQAMIVLGSQEFSQKQKSIALAVVLHLVGDAHQPLHCINRFSQKFPKGDKGGNLFLINTAYAYNLHAYWDQGSRLLIKSKTHYPLTNKNISRLAQEIQQTYPPSFFSNKDLHDLDPAHWANQSFEIAKNNVYHLKPGSKPSAAYVQAARGIIAQQLALSGYRLGLLIENCTIGAIKK